MQKKFGGSQRVDLIDLVLLLKKKQKKQNTESICYWICSVWKFLKFC